MNLAVIPARSGSKRIPGKNIRLFHGNPILAYSIAVAYESGLFPDVVVSTESPEYAKIAKAFGAKIHMRARYLADDLTGTQEVMRATLAWWRANHAGEVPELACCIYATAPLLLASDLVAGLSLLPGHPYAYVPGLYYFGRPEAFLTGVPIDAGIEVPFPVGRYIDINTEEDWQRAECLYEAVRKESIVA